MRRKRPGKLRPRGGGRGRPWRTAVLPNPPAASPDGGAARGLGREGGVGLVESLRAEVPPASQDWGLRDPEGRSRWRGGVRAPPAGPSPGAPALGGRSWRRRGLRRGWHKAGPSPAGAEGGGERAAPPGLRPRAWRPGGCARGGGSLSWRVEGAARVRRRPRLPAPRPRSLGLWDLRPLRGGSTNRGLRAPPLPGGSDGPGEPHPGWTRAGSPGLPRLCPPPRYAFPWRVPWAPGPSGNKRSWGWGWGRCLAPGPAPLPPALHLPSATRGPPSAGPTAPPRLAYSIRGARPGMLRDARGAGGPSW